MTVRRGSVVLTVSILSLMILVVLSRGSERSSTAARFLDVEMRTSAGTVAQLYWADDFAFNAERSVRLPLRPVDGFQHLRFPLPPESARWLRLDPMNGSGEVWIRTAEVLDSNGKVISVLSPEHLHPYQQIASMTREGGMTRLVTTPGGTDPFVLASLSSVAGGSAANFIFLVTPVTLTLVTAAVLALLIASIVAVGRAAFERVPAVSMEQSRWQLAVWMGVLFLIVFSANLFLMRENPVTTPFWDQWDIEASSLYVPYHEGGLTWGMMFSLANEHRVFFTRLLALDLLIANGQWDPRLQQVVDVIVHAVTAVLLVTILWLASGRRRLDLLVFIGGLCFALPFAWENTLLPIHSAAYLLVLFSILSLWLTTTYSSSSGTWLLGWLCAVCALFTFGSGIVVPVAIMGMVALKSVSDRGSWRELAANGVAAGLILASGVAMLSPPLPGHAPLKARTVAEFATAFGHSLSWPWIYDRWPSLVVWLPVCLMLTAAIGRRGKTTPLERLVVGLAIWVVVGAAAIAYGRGAAGAMPAMRYMDYLSLGFVANAMALVAIVERMGNGKVVHRVGLAVLGCWLIWVSAGVDQLVGRALTDLTAWRQYFANQAANVRRLTMTGDYGQFMMQPPLVQLPYPDPGRLTTLLQDAYIQQILPAAVRAPLRVEPRVVTEHGFILQQPDRGVPYDPLARAWWSLSDEGRRATGRFESMPMACGPGGRLRFQVSGYLGWKHQYLALKDLMTGRDRAVRPSELAQEAWQDVTVSCPPGSFEVVAIDEAPDSWFGFREPIEIGRSTVAIEWLISESRVMLIVGLALAVLAVRGTTVKPDAVSSVDAAPV
jgi:hypothetical protein